MPKSATIACPSCEQNVLGLDVAMDDAVAMRVVERDRHLDRDLHRVVDRELAFAIEPLAQRFAGDERHHVVQQMIRRLSRIVECQNIRMTDLRGQLDFAAEAFRTECHPEVRKQHLDGYLAIMPEIFREINSRHASASQLAHDLVPPFQGGPQPIETVRHRVSVPCVKRR